MYYEVTEDIVSAITREKQIKKWNRAWKIRLIEEMNPEWEDLYYKLIGESMITVDSVDQLKG